MRVLFANNWKYVAGGGTALAYQAWFDRMKSNKESSVFRKGVNETLDSIKEELVDINKKIEAASDPNVKKDLLENFNILKKKIEEMKAISDKFCRHFEDGQISSDSAEATKRFESYQEAFEKAFKVGKTAADNLEKGLNKFMEDNVIWKMINDFKLYLDSLSSQEICLFINISTSIFILTCIITILFAFFGNYLIEWFSLEKKFPGLTSLIKIRLKFQRFYIYTNSILIVLAVLSLIIVNTITLIYA